MCAKTARVAVAARADVHPVPVVVIRVHRAAAPHVAQEPALRVARRALRTAVAGTISRQRRTVMIGLLVVRAAVIVVVRVVPIRASRVRIRRARIIPVRRVTQVPESRMDKAVRRVRLARPAMPATPPSSVAGMSPKVWRPDHARDDPAAIRMQRVRTRDVPAPAARVVRVGMERRAVPASMRDPTSNAHSHRGRMATVHAATVRKAVHHAART
jgi:hypothetical protein